MSRVICWEAYEVIGVGIPNPRAVSRMPIPEDLTPEQLKSLEEALDALAESDLNHGAVA